MTFRALFCYAVSWLRPLFIVTPWSDAARRELALFVKKQA